MKFNTEHRPWPMPSRPWVMAMDWLDLLFMHWPVPATSLRPWIPSGLELEEFNGSAWLGVVPFRMEGVRPRCCPSIPGLCNFAELNVRTYVRSGEKSGVWFFSLDAENPLAVRVARATFHLPYMDAKMQCQSKGTGIRYRSTRTHRQAPPATLHVNYGPTSDVWYSTPGTFEHWLTERYCLYSADRRGRIWCGDIHHDPWPLQSAECEIEENTMSQQLKIDLPKIEPICHFARAISVVGWTIVERKTSR